ncbi:HNH endonuclease [Amycolatopsis antarctica]|uniref:HNH endonuclease n=2 Tax=Amycolatopsis antarctica TaxID=1854586 RepID=A0A263CXS9_9PSEU|nr:HNH endonuclease [Amycolatopsis antarctica]
MESLSPRELLRVIRDAGIARARAEATQLRTMARFAELSGDARGVDAELALLLSTTEHQAQRQVAMASALTTRLPRTLSAMEAGVIDAYKASKIVDATNPLSDCQAHEVDSMMAGRLAGKNPTGIRRAVVRLVALIDPDGHAARAAKRRAERNVQLVHQDDGIATLAADLPVEVASAIYSRVDRIARTLRGKDEARTLEQLRADVLAELCLGLRDAEPRAEVFVHVAATTLAGVDDDPAELAGHGPVPAWLARHLAAHPDSVLRKVVTDPVNGTVRDVGRTRYRPPAALDELVRVRDRECRAPGCHRPAHQADLDHVEEWSAGGATAARNLTALCRKHHRLKDQPGWRYDADAVGTLTVTTPTGIRCITRPEPLREASLPAPF